MFSTAVTESWVDDGAWLTGVASSVIVPGAGPVPEASRTSVVMTTSRSQPAAGTKVTAASAALTCAAVPVTVQMPRAAS